MYDNSPPRRLPQNMLAIFFATIVACSGYVVFAARFGDPTRRAEQAARKIESYDNRLPGMIDSAVTAKLDSDETIVRFGEVDPTVAETLQQLEARIAELEVMVQVAQATAGRAQTEPRGASPTPIDREPITESPSGEAPSVTAPQHQPSQPVTTNPIQKLSDRRSGLLLRLTGTQATDGRVRIDFTITKETPGDGEIFIPPPRPRGKSRLIADNGTVLNNGSSGVAGERVSSNGARAQLPSGIPVGFTIMLESNVEPPFVARVVEIEARIGEGLRQSVAFELSEIAIAR